MERRNLEILAKLRVFTTQTYKHINSGEGGIITTNDPKVAARCVILSGSYMLDRHEPTSSVYRDVKLETPNCSARLDNLRQQSYDQLIDLDMNIIAERALPCCRGRTEAQKFKRLNDPIMRSLLALFQFRHVAPRRKRNTPFIEGVFKEELKSNGLDRKNLSIYKSL